MPRHASLSGFIRTFVTIARYVVTGHADLSGTTAANIASRGLAFGYEIERFGFRTDGTALTGGPQTYLLRDANNNTIATLVVTAALAAHTTVSTTAIDANYRDVLDGGILTVRRSASGTAITAGTGEFFIVARQRLQARS